MTDFPKPLDPAPRCRDCQVALEPGFCLEIDSGLSTNVGRWAPAPLRHGFLGFVEVARSSYDHALLTITYRCPKCFRLESFAPPKPT